MYQSNGIMKGLLALGIATGFFFASCDSKKGAEVKSEPKSTSTTHAAVGAEGRIAYVDMDTLQVKYEYLKTEKANLEKQSAALEAELARGAQTLQNEAMAFQKKAQAGGYTSQAEGEAAQARLGKMQSDLESKRQTMGAQLMKKSDDFTKDLQTRLDKFLEKYNADKHYDYILQYQKGGTILFANPDLDITDDVAKGMNEEDKAKK